MVYFVEGTVVDKSGNLIVLENQNFGFEVFFLKRDEFILLNKYRVYLYCSISNEYEISYYGFLSKFDLKIFKKLIKVQGIGCKSAYNILNSLSAQELMNFISNEDYPSLKKMIGGSKASNIFIALKKDLNNPLNFLENENLYVTLKNLGYKNDQIRNVLPRIDLSLNEEEALKQALKLISYGK